MLSKFFTTAAFAALVTAQTFTDCDPTKRDDCPARKAIGSKVVEIDFRKGANKFFEVADGTSLKYDNELGALFSISKATDAPTIGSKQWMFFGQVDVVVRAARGAGIVTSFVLQSDDLDEIDWEWIGSDNAQVQHNFFSKGCTEVYDRGGFSPVADPINQFHTYTIKWTPEQLDWIIDGAVVRTLKNTGIEGCSGYPQSPMQIKLGTWVAGKEGAPQGTIEWAGGLADFSDIPFDGYYQSLRIQDYMGGAKEATEYQYTDKTGTWQSIKVVNNGEEEDKDSSSSKTSTTAKPTTTKATTLSTVSSTGTATGTGTGTATTDASEPTETPTDTEENQEGDEESTSISTAGAAPTMAANMAAMGAAALFGYLAL
jgi:beta-glucanase (GH16 family)